MLILNTHYLTWTSLGFEGTSPGFSPWAKKFGVCSSFIILAFFSHYFSSFIILAISLMKTGQCHQRSFSQSLVFRKSLKTAFPVGVSSYVDIGKLYINSHSTTLHTLTHP